MMFAWHLIKCVLLQDLEDQRIRSEQEIQTLQQLIQETCDESTAAHTELIRLHDENERIKQEIVALREQQQVNSSLLS